MKNVPEQDYERGHTDARRFQSQSELFPQNDALGFDTRSNTLNPILDIASPLLGLVIRLEGTENSSTLSSYMRTSKP
ncbi:hypothetical protein [Pseudomonas fulva]|uniref:hypothetical protein n=1 Tax=Pseudomonas fulva TaxID=47880 RepID=UPI001F20BAEB|nr:hypothetical protein [Pseudomonas fulva]